MNQTQHLELDPNLFMHSLRQPQKSQKTTPRDRIAKLGGKEGPS